MPETTNNFRNIISVVASATTAQTALTDIFNTLRGIQTAAREAGMVMDQLLAKQAAVSQMGVGGGTAQAAQPRNIWQRLRDITMGGEEVTGAGSGRGLPASQYFSGRHADVYEQQKASQAATEQQFIARLGAQNAAKEAQAKSEQFALGQGTFGFGGANRAAPSRPIQPVPESMPGMNPAIAAQIQAALGQGGGQLANPAIAAQFAKVSDGATAATPAIKSVGQAAVSTGQGFEKMAGHIVGGMFVWQSVNMVVNTLSQTFETVKKNYLAVDDAAAKLSVTMGIGKDAAEGYAQSMVGQGAKYGVGVQESLAAASFGARVQKAPEQRQQLFDVSAQLSQRTGEDQLKLMDNLNVASRQSGLSIMQTGDMAESAYNKTGTSATQALDIIRELGPIAQSSGVDINTLFETVIKSADRMGGSASDATNTWTRLWKAVTEPNKAQIDVLNKYQIPLSADVNTKMSQITKAGLTPEEMGVMSGRPGMPAAANDMRTMFEVMKTLDGELSRGPKLADDYAKSVDSLDFSFKKFFAGIQSGMGLTVGLLEKGLSGGGTDRIMRMYGYDEATIAKVKDAQAKIARETSGIGVVGAAGAAMKVPETHYYQDYLDNQMDLEERKNRRTGASALAPTTPAPVTPPWTAESSIKNLIESKLVNMPTSPTDLTKYTRAELGGIGGQGKKQEQAWIESLDRFYTSMKVDPKEKDKLLLEAQKSIDTFVAVFKTPQGISVEYGAEAYYKQQNLQQQGELLGAAPNTGADISQYTDAEVKAAMSQTSAIAQNWMNSWREFYEAQGLDQSQIDALMAAKQEGVDKTIGAFQSGPNSTIVTGQTAAYLPQALQQVSQKDALEEQLKELRKSMEDLNDTTKKASKMEGLWNIPVGARILAPFAGKAVEPEGKDTSDEARKAREMESLKERERIVLEKLARLENPDAIKQLPAAKDVGMAPRAAAPAELPPPLFRQKEPGERMEKPTPSATVPTEGLYSNNPENWGAPAAAEFDSSTAVFSSSAANFKEGATSFVSAVNGLSSLQGFANTFGSAVESFLVAVGKMQWQGTSPASTGPTASGQTSTALYPTMTNDLINQARIQGVLSQ